MIDLIVVVRPLSEVNTAAKASNWKTYEDGYVTAWGTFQKGMTNDELMSLAQMSQLDCKPLKLGGLTGCLLNKAHDVVYIQYV